MPIEEFIGNLQFNDIKKGEILRVADFDRDDKMTIPIRARKMRDFVNDMSKFYYAGKIPTKTEFEKIFKKHEKEVIDESNNLLDQLENSEDLFKVSKRIKERNGKIIFELTPINKDERIKLIKSIATKLATKVSKEQLVSMFEEGIRLNTDTQDLEKIDKELNKKDVKIKEDKGCFKFVVGNKDIMVMR